MMVRPTIEVTRTILFLVLTTLLILALCGTTCFTATTASAITELKTYTDPGGFFTLQYPTDWTAEYKQPVTKFDKPYVVFTSNDPVSVVTISVQHSPDNTPEEFRDSMSSLASDMANRNPGMTITPGQGFGIYSIAGYDTYAFAYHNSQDPANPHKGMMLISRIGYQLMTIVFDGDSQTFDKQWPIVQKMIDSIKITGIR